MIVLDSSAVVELVLGTSAGSRVAVRIALTHESLHAPHLLDVEVTHALRRLEGSGTIPEQRAREGLIHLNDLFIHRYPHDMLVPRAWQLRRNVTAYDAMYLALAEALSAPLLTRDERLAATPGHEARVELV